MGEVATPTAGHQDLAADLFGVLQQQNPAAPVGSGCGAHQARGTATDNDNIVIDF